MAIKSSRRRQRLQTTATEQALLELNETLEQRVAERTRALAEANLQLQCEILERARAEEALRHGQKMEAVGQLTGGIAHDFKVCFNITAVYEALTVNVAVLRNLNLKPL